MYFKLELNYSLSIHFIGKWFTLFAFHRILMERGTLFSSIECFISPQSKRIYYDETEKKVEDVLFDNGCIVHSFLNEFVSLIILSEEEYNPFFERYPEYQFLPCVTPHWILHSILNETMLPYVVVYCFNDF